MTDDRSKDDRSLVQELAHSALCTVGWSVLAADTAVVGVACLGACAVDETGVWAHHIGRFWSRLNLRLMGAELQVRGREHVDPAGTYVLMVNHQSHLDTWVVVAALPMQLRYVMKQELRRVPLFGVACARMGHIYVERGNSASAWASLAEAARRIAAGASVVFYPEGTRSRDGRLGPFKTGGFRLALQAGVPILPITVRGTRDMFPPGTWRFSPGRAVVTIHEPIATAGCELDDVEGLEALVARTRAVIGSALPG
jgi:1-acyl-sn-glycerol-3-phosphate acyltransferase